MIIIYALLIVLLNFCCYFISWSALGLLFSSIIIINCTLRTYCPLNSNCHLVWLSSYSIWWCFTYIFLLPLYVLYPLSTHKFLATIVIGSSVICVNLACYALILLELRQHPLSLFYSAVLRPLCLRIHRSLNVSRARLSPRGTCKEVNQSDVSERDGERGGREESGGVTGMDSATTDPDGSSVKKRQLYQTLKCVMAMKRRIRKYRESKQARLAGLTTGVLNDDVTRTSE